MGRPQKHDPEIDVLPYMDSMVIVLNVICLIIIIMIIPIIENSKQVSSLSFEKLLRSKLVKDAQTLSPVYFDCRSDGVTILPGDITVPVEALIQPGNEVEKVINRIQALRALRVARAHFVLAKTWVSKVSGHRHTLQSPSLIVW